MKRRRDDSQRVPQGQGRRDELADSCDEMQRRATCLGRSLLDVVVEQVVERAVVVGIVVVDVDADIVAIGIEAGGVADVHAHRLVVVRKHVGAGAVDEREYRDHDGKGFPRIAEILLDRSQGGPWILATVSNGDGGEYEHFVRNADGKWSQVTKFEDRVKKVVFGGRDRLFLLSVKGAVRGQVLRVDLGEDNPTVKESKVVVPEAAGSAITDIAASSTDLLVNGLSNLLGLKPKPT